MLNKLLCRKLERTRSARDKWMHSAINLRSDLDVMSERLRDLYKDKGNLIDENFDLRNGIKAAIDALYGKAGGATDSEKMDDCEEILKNLIGEAE